MCIFQVDFENNMKGSN